MIKEFAAMRKESLAGLREFAVVVGLLSLLLAPLVFPSPVVAQVADGSEVIAVEDITLEANCVYTAETYADKEQAQLVRSATSACPPGSVLRAERMTKEAAETRGLPFVVVTGDSAADEAAVDELKRHLLEVIRGPVPEVGEAVDGGASRLGGCDPPAYFARYLSYNAAGGRVNVGVSQVPRGRRRVPVRLWGDSHL